MCLAKSKQDLLYVIESNTLKRKCNESEVDLRVLENQYSDLEKKRKILDKKRKKMQKNVQFTTFFNTCKIMKKF